MSSKDMFRKEQRFSFRKFSFGLASAVIANVIFGGAIASSPVVHANTTTETAAVATSERIASIPYTVNIVDQTGKVVETKEKKVLVYTVETIATATEYLTADLVPEGYAIVSGLGEVTLTENAENVFTVKVDKIAPEAVATTTTAESATSETATAAATPEPASLTATQPTPVTSEVAEAEVAPTTSEESAKPTERTVYLSYITHYVNEANETVDRTGHLVAVTTTDDTAKTQVTVSASENMPSGWELVQDKAKVVVQLVENQTNILVFAVTKKSKEEEIAESQLSNRDVLMRLSLEADLLADEALRQVAKEQAGNTALEAAANETKAVAATANEVLANTAATEAELDDQIDTVRTSTQNLAAEMLKVDADGVLTAQLNTTQVSRPANYQEIGTEAGAFHPDKPNLTRYLFIFGTSEGTTEDANGATGTAPVADKTNASRALVPEGTITNIVYNDGTSNLTNGTLGSNLTMGTDGKLSGSYNHTAGGAYTRKLLVTTDTGTHTSNNFTTYAYTDQASSEPVKKLEGVALTVDDIFGNEAKGIPSKMAIATTSAAFQNAGKNIPTVPESEYTRTIVGYRTVTEDAFGEVTPGVFVEQTDLAQFPTNKDYQVKVQTTNVYGQTIYNWVNVDYDLKASMPTIGVDPGTTVKNGDNRQLEALFVFGNVTGTTEAVSTSGSGTAPDFDTAKATKSFLATDPETEAAKAAIEEINANTSKSEEEKAAALAKQEAKKETVTISYGVPGNVTEYVAGNPDSVKINNRANNPISAPVDSLGHQSKQELLLDVEGKLTGEFPYAPGGFYSRVVKMTDTAGNVSYSNPFFVISYTDKLIDDTPVAVNQGTVLTENNIFGKLTIDTTSGSTGTNQSLTVPESEYTRAIVGYRTVDGTTKGELVEQTDLTQFPTDKDLEVKVQTTNPYGQTIYNWVKVDYNLKPKVEIVDAVGGETKTVYVFSKNNDRTENSEGVTGTNVAFDKNKATKALVNITDDGQVTAISYTDGKSAVSDLVTNDKIPNAVIDTDGFFNGDVDALAGGSVTRVVKVTDNANVVGDSPRFRIFPFSDTVPADVTPVSLVKGTRPALEEITAKMVIDSNSGYPNNAKVEIPKDAYTRTVVGYRLDGSQDTVAVDSVEKLPTEGSYKVRVKTSNAYGQEIYNWVPVSHYKLEEVSRDIVTKYTDFESPIHAIIELGSSGTVGTVKLEGDRPADFNIANFNLKADEAAKLAERNLEFVKADSLGTDGTVGTIRPKDGGKVEYTGSGNLDYVFEYTYQVNNENKTSNLTYTILYTDTQKPIMTPKSEYIRFVDEEYKISVPGTDNAFLSTEKINGSLSVLKDGESGKVSPGLGTNTAIASELDPKGVDVSGGVDNQGGNSTMFNVNITGTAPSAEGTGTYNLRVGENNYPAGPNVERVDGKVPENVGLTPVTVTFVKRAAMTTPVAVVDPANLTADEKAAVIAQLKKDNADNEKLNALPDTAFTVNADGTVSVDYSAGNTGVDAVTDKVANATVKLADEQKKAKDAIDTKLAEEKAAIEAKRDEAIAEINNTPGLTDDQKKAATDAVTNTANDALTDLQTAADDAKKAIDTETTVAGINDAKTAGEKALDDAKAVGEAAINLTKDKELAKADVDNQAKTAIEAIKNNPNLDATEQAPYIEAIEKAAEEQKAAIDKAKDTAGITDAVNAAEKVNEEQQLAAAKEDAKDKIAEEAAAAKDAIDDNPNLSDVEKTAAKNAVDTEVAKANDAIDKATTPETVQAAEDNGVKAIDAEELVAAKQDAKNKIAEDVKAAKDAIDKDPNLSEDEKKGFKDAVDTEAAKAVADIEKATTPAEAQTAEEAGTAAIAEDVLDAAKQDAKNKIAEDVKAAKDAIDKNPNLSKEEKQTFKDAVDDAAKTANDAIDKATTPETVQTAEDNGVKAIDAKELAAAKQDAKNKIAEDVKAAKEAIDNNPNLSKEEKQTFKDAVDDAAKTANDAIDKATTPETVQTAEDNGVNAIDAKELAAAKQDAKNKIAEDVKAAKDAIDNNPNLSKEEKQTFKDAVDDAAKTANGEIDKATTPETVQTAEDNGVKAIDAKELDAAKQDAKNKIAKDVEAAKDAIDKNPNLSEDEKQGFKDAVDVAAQTANGEIDKATTPETVQTAEDNGVKAIDAKELAAAKQDAKNKIAEEAAAAKDAIDKNPNLSEDEKRTFKDAVDKAAQTANDAIDKATTPAEVQTAEDNGVKAIDAKELDAAKQDAKNKIAKDVEAANAAIESNPNLSEKEIADAKAEVAKAAEDANKAIAAATTPETAQAAEETGTKEIAADVLDAAKQDAKNKIAKDLATVEAAIDANSNLSEDEKKAAKLAAQAKAADAVTNIEKATTPAAVQTLEDAAVKELANIEIKAAYDDAVKAIEAADNLSTAAKSQALDDLKKARQAAEKAITDATTADEVATAALAGVKSLAKVEAKAAADDAKAAIAQNSNLTDDEKKVYTDAIDKALKATETKIDDATDADTVDAETVLAQKDIAKQEVAAATADAVKGIEANTNLTDAKKDEYKATVTTAAEKAEKAITDATTAADIQSKTFDATQDVAKEEVKADAADAIAGIKANDNLSDTAKEEAIAAIEKARNTTLENIENAKTAAAVDTATLDAEKANAKAEIKAAADDAKKAIDENANLPVSEKNALKLAIDAEVAATNLEIDDAKTAEEIDAATLATEKSIAKAEVKAAAEDALRAIDENANLTDDEKAAAKAKVYVELSKAEKAIDKATTADAIDNATLVGEKAFATAELEAAADDAKKAIDANTHLTDDQKQAAKDAVDAELAKAKEAVVAAKTADEVDAATLVGEKAIAKEEIKAAADDAKKAIDANSNLTDDEKAAAKAAVDTEVAKANEAIDKAATADAVDTATLVGEKAVAKEELKAAADDAKKAIDENANLTPEEKAAAKKAVDDEVAKAEKAIDAATKAEEVDTATLAGEKAVAKEEVKAAAEDAKAAIDANDNLTPEEKAAAKAAVDAEVAKANDAIDAATKADEVDAATLAGEKAVAKEELKAAAEDAKAAIDANDNLTPEEKAAAKDAVDAEVAKANDAIDAATSAEEVDTATLAGEKAVAKEELKAAAEDAKKAIDANPNLSDAEKQAAKDAVDASAAAANKAIDGSTSSVEVQAAKDKGNAAIAENVLDAAKQGAKNKLMEEADKAKAAIDANPNLTPEEKAAAKAEIDKAVEEAIIAINGAGTHHALGEIKLPLSALIKPVVTVTPVLDPNNLTEEEIARIKALLEENNTFPEGTEIIVSKDASVSIKYPDGTIDLVLPAEVVKQADTTAPAITDDAKGNIVVAPSEEAVELVVTYVDNNGKAQLVIVTKGADGKWTTTDKVVIVDPVTGQVIIPGSAIKPGTVVTAYSKDMAGNVSDLNSAEVEAVDANNPAAGVKVKSVTSTSNANKSTKKAKQLPNTGEKATSATSLGLAVLGMGLALFAAKRKKDEEEA
ncbi:DUF1542 domain-containing protein [Streptococcus suis]|uniref:Large variant extracellular factor n=9 Tax=Streptococcus suis TaxID=1307 RepID=A0A0Z8K640_STRSU|nr:DUF1542 domain-containing protein [Streptococcus suis]CYV66354.1 large variant extracellular factor [Streptococcus suis]